MGKIMGYLTNMVIYIIGGILPTIMMGKTENIVFQMWNISWGYEGINITNNMWPFMNDKLAYTPQ
jgi:hypothetical protein